MIEALFWVVVGMFLGWHFPQPDWVASLQKRVTEWMRNKLAK